MEQQQLSFDFKKVQPQIIAARRDEELKLRLGDFAGPLDLLLHLIKQERANIFDIPIARITNAYLEHLRVMKEMDISVAGDFLVMAATLIEIKSKMLLPRDVLLDGDGEDIDIDPRGALIHRLLEHQKFKNAAQILWEQATVEQSLFGRGRLETDETSVETNVGLFDLLGTFQKILARRTKEITLEIEREEMSLSEILANLKAKIFTDKNLSLSEFFSQIRTRRELVLTFLAVLELAKAAEIKLTQSEIFGDIVAQAV